MSWYPSKFSRLSLISQDRVLIIISFRPSHLKKLPRPETLKTTNNETYSKASRNTQQRGTRVSSLTLLAVYMRKVLCLLLEYLDVTGVVACAMGNFKILVQHLQQSHHSLLILIHSLCDWSSRGSGKRLNPWRSPLVNLLQMFLQSQKNITRVPST